MENLREILNNFTEQDYLNKTVNLHIHTTCSDGLGNYVPTPIDPIFWKDIKDDNTGSWGTYLSNLKASLLQEVRNGNKKEAIKKLAELRDMLIFGVGNNIFYNETIYYIKIVPICPSFY